eukprot:TRINITY_DN848_c0_g2_i1.p1 TRINITY_DN848_c0_g2~~TRINITY_DN848_c0_g2_i1.p1  ORF type:complete len:724 (+),score=180.28 TRINITY_DN848_c0_g2_i1:139-2310(+)
MTIGASASRSKDYKRKKRALPSLAKGRIRDGEAAKHIPEDIQTWPRRWANAFKAFAKGQHLLSDSEGMVLTSVVRRAGSLNISEETLQPLIKQLSRYPLLAAPDVFNFLKAYEDGVVEIIESAFLRNAHFGLINNRQLIELFSECGYVLLPHQVKEVLQEASAMLNVECPDTKTGSIDLQLFFRALELLVDREGFPKSQFASIMATCKRFDNNGSGFFETRELPPVITWLKFCSEPDTVNEALQDAVKAVREAAENDARHMPEESPCRPSAQVLDGCIDYLDFMQLMRKAENIGHARTAKLFNKLDADNDGALTITELRHLFSTLGLQVSAEALFEGVIEGVKRMREYYSYSHFCSIFQVLRDKEGLSQAKLDEARARFQYFDKTGTGKITTRQAERALMSSGFKLGVSIYGENIFWKSQYSTSGQLCEAEFLRVWRLHDEGDLRMMRKVFRKYAENQGAGVLRKKDLQTAVRVANARFARYYQSWVQEHGSPADFYDFEDFRELIEMFRDMVCGTFRAAQGFTQEELKPLQAAFDKREPNAEGMLSDAKVGDLLVYLIPSLTWDGDLRDMLREVLRTNNATSSPLNFEAFLKVMRDLKDACNALHDASAPLLCEQLGIAWDRVDVVLDAYNLCLFCREQAPQNLSDATLALLYGSGPPGQSVSSDGLSLVELKGLKLSLARMLKEKHAATVEDFVAIVRQLRRLPPAKLAHAASEGGEKKKK